MRSSKKRKQQQSEGDEQLVESPLKKPDFGKASKNVPSEKVGQKTANVTGDFFFLFGIRSARSRFCMHFPGLKTESSTTFQESCGWK